MSSISVEYEGLKSLAAKLKSCGDNFETDLSKCIAEVDMLAKSWEGEDGVKYVNKVHEHEQRLKEVGTITKNYGDFLDMVGREYSNTQENVMGMINKIE